MGCCHQPISGVDPGKRNHLLYFVCSRTRVSFGAALTRRSESLSAWKQPHQRVRSPKVNLVLLVVLVKGKGFDQYVFAIKVGQCSRNGLHRGKTRMLRWRREQTGLFPRLPKSKRQALIRVRHEYKCRCSEHIYCMLIVDNIVAAKHPYAVRHPSATLMA